MKIINKWHMPIIGACIMLFCTFKSCNTPNGSNTHQMQAPEKTVELPINNSKLGIGLVHMNLNESIPLYKSKEDTIPYDTLSFKKQDQGIDKGICLFITNILADKLKPYTLKKGDSYATGKEHVQMGLISFSPELTFRVIERDSKGATIVVNEDSRETSYIKLTAANDLNLHQQRAISYFDPHFIDTKIRDWYFFEYWEEALKRAFLIRIPENTLVFDSPNKNPIPLDLGASYKIDKTESEWAHIVSTDGNVSNKKINGWIRWRDDDRLLISFRLHGGYE